MPSEFLKKYLREISNIFERINTKEFTVFIEELLAAYERKSYIFVCGNGGSASTASHFACDINKGVSFGKNKRFKMISLNDNIPILLAYANDIAYDDIFVEQLKNLLAKDDLVIGISASGNSNNVLKAIEYANKNGGKTFGICGFNGGKLRNLAQRAIAINSNDMQKVEDLHSIFLHCAMQYLLNSIK